MVQAFFDHLSRIRASKHTQSNYRRDLLAFLRFYRGEWLAEEIESELQSPDHFLETFDLWKDIPSSAIQSFLAQRMEAGIAPSSVARQLSALRTFYQFLLERGVVMHNPAKGVRAPKRPKPLPKSVDVDVTRRLLEVTSENWTDLRNQAMFEVLYSAGLRVSELADLDLSPGLDQWESGWLHVRGKGDKERQAPIGHAAQQALARWLQKRTQHAHAEEQAVFVNRFGRRLSVRSIQKALDQRALQTGVPTKMSPHRLRHACATHVLESSGDLRAVQEMLGHANLSTTQIYTRLDLQHLAQVYDQSHPRAKRSQHAQPPNPSDERNSFTK